MQATTGRGAAARRRLAELRAEGELPDLPQDLHDLLTTFAPQGPLAVRWVQFRPLVADILRASRVRGRDSFRKHLTHLGYFYVWAEDHGLPVGTETLTRRRVDEYVRTGMAGSSAKSRADRRARLRSLADQLHADQAPHPASIPRPAIRPPYTDREMTQITRVCRTQPTPGQKRKLSLVVGLGAGAGVDASDLRHLRRANITETQQGLLVHVPVGNIRTIAVIRDYESLVRAGINGIGRNALLLGRDTSRRNIAARAVDEAVILGDCPHIEQTRLRTTWLARLMAASVPLGILLPAAGLRSARTLTDVLVHLPAADPARCLSALRDPVGSR